MLHCIYTMTTEYNDYDIKQMHLNEGANVSVIEHALTLCLLMEILLLMCHTVLYHTIPSHDRCLSQNDIANYETSAKDASNVELAFETLARNALAVQQERKPIFIPDTLDLNKTQQQGKTQGCCSS